MNPTFRCAVPACSHADTFKYFLDPSWVEQAWVALAQAFGPSRLVPGVEVRHIDGTSLSIRAPAWGNPLTVMRGRSCTAADVARLHDILGYRDSP